MRNRHLSAITPNEQARNKAVVRTMLDAADRGDFETLAACYADDYRDGADAGSRRLLDKNETLAVFRELYRAFPDIGHTIHELIAEGDKVVLRVSATGTHRADLWGISRTDRTISQTQTAIYQLSGGRIIRRWVDGSQAIASQLEGPDPVRRPPTCG